MGKVVHRGMRNFLLMVFVTQLDSDHLHWSQLSWGFSTAFGRWGELGMHAVFGNESFINQCIWNLYAFRVIFMMVLSFQLLGKWQNHSSSQKANRHITHLPSSPQLLKTQNTASRNYSPFKAWGFDELEICGSHSLSQKGSALAPQRGWGLDGNYTWINLLPLLSARCVRPRHDGLLNIMSQQGNGGETETCTCEKPFSMA